MTTTFNATKAAQQQAMSRITGLTSAYENTLSRAGDSVDHVVLLKQHIATFTQQMLNIEMQANEQQCHLATPWYYSRLHNASMMITNYLAFAKLANIDESKLHAGFKDEAHASFDLAAGVKAVEGKWSREVSLFRNVLVMMKQYTELYRNMMTAQEALDAAVRTAEVSIVTSDDIEDEKKEEERQESDERSVPQTPKEELHPLGMQLPEDDDKPNEEEYDETVELMRQAGALTDEFAEEEQMQDQDAIDEFMHPKKKPVPPVERLLQDAAADVRRGGRNPLVDAINDPNTIKISDEDAKKPHPKKTVYPSSDVRSRRPAPYDLPPKRKHVQRSMPHDDVRKPTMKPQYSDVRKQEQPVEPRRRRRPPMRAQPAGGVRRTRPIVLEIKPAQSVYKKSSNDSRKESSERSTRPRRRRSSRRRPSNQS